MDASNSRSDASDIGVSSTEVEGVGVTLGPRAIMEISMEVGSSVKVVFERHLPPFSPERSDESTEVVKVEDGGVDGSVGEEEALTIESGGRHEEERIRDPFNIVDPGYRSLAPSYTSSDFG